MNPSPFEIGRKIGNNFANVRQQARDESAIDKILSDAMDTEDPAILQNSIGKILSQVSPERQALAIQYLQGRYNNIEKKRETQRLEDKKEEERLREEMQKKEAATKAGVTFGLHPTVQSQELRNKQQELKDQAKQARLAQYGLVPAEPINQPQASKELPSTQPTNQPPASIFKKLTKDQLIVASGAEDREISEPAKAELKARSDEEALAQKKEDRKIKFGQDIGKKVLEKADTIAEAIPQKQSALNLMKDAIANKNLGFWSWDNLAELTGIEGLRSKEGAIFKTAAKEYFLGNISRAGARPNQWIEQQISDMLTKIGRSTEANLSVSRALQNELDIDKERVRLTQEIADELDKTGGDYRKLGSMVNERLSKYAEAKQNELFNDLRAIAAIGENKPQKFHKVSPGTPLSEYIVDGLLINFNNDPEKAANEAKKLGYSVE